MTRALKIELLGLPGSGKTTVARLLEQALGQAGIGVRSRAQQQAEVSDAHAARSWSARPAAYLWSCALERRRLRRVAELALLARPFRPAALGRIYVYSRQLQNKRILCEATRGGTTWLLDQDLMQELCYGILYLRDCPSVSSLRALLWDLYPLLPDVLLHLELDPRLAVERMRRRAAVEGPGGEIDRMGVLTERELRAGVTEASRIASILAEIGRTRVAGIDASGSPEDVASRALPVLLEALGASRQGTDDAEAHTLASRDR